MAPPIVYGKKSRTRKVDAFAALAESSSPDSSIKTQKSKNQSDDLVESMSKCQIQQVKSTKSRPRKALAETCGNKISPARMKPRPKKINKTIESAIEDRTKRPAQVGIVPELRTPQKPKSINLETVEPQLRRSPRRKQPAIEPASEPRLPATTDVYEQHCSSLLQLSQHGIGPFDEWSTQLAEHFTITKIAEASFGEVYRLSLQQDFDDLTAGDESVFKVIALKPPSHTLPTDKKKRAAALKKAEAMSKVEDVANEVLLLQRMSFIPGFTNFRDLRIVTGRPPTAFIDASKAFNKTQKAKGKDLSMFPDPAKKTSYPEDQLWTIIEMQDAGTDLERLLENSQCTSIYSIWDIFWQVTLSLAKGESGAEFEHRDLHLGNICIRQPPVPLPIDPTKKLNLTGLETTVIDYTISRCTIPSSTTIAYHDLSPPSEAFLFEADSTMEYQYDIYRYMRSAVFHGDPLATFRPESKKAMRKSWEGFHPLTNVVWLHFVLYKLMEGREKGKGKGKGRERELEDVLRVVQEYIDPEALGFEGALGSASDLVRVALEEGWVDLEDVVGVEEGEEIVLEEELVDAVKALDIEEGTPRRSPRKTGKKTKL